MTIKNTDLFYVQRPDGADEGSYKIKYEDLNIPDGGIDEAPEDGKTYGRKDKSWTEVTGGGGGGDVSVEDDGTEIVATASTLNFTGDGVTVTANGNTANIAIPGGGGGGGDTTINYNGASAWGYFLGSADPITSSGLNYSVTATGAGVYQITFTTPMPSDDYSVTVGGDAYLTRAYDQDANGFELRTFNSGSNAAHGYNTNFAVFATNALPPTGTTGSDAWVTADATQTITGSFNVASVTKQSTGKYLVTFTTPMPTNGYAAICNAASFTSYITDRTTDSFVVNVKSATDFFDAPISAVVFATNANLPLTVTQEQIEAAINNPGLSAWCSTVKTTVNGPVPIANGSNVASVTRTGTGVYDIVFTTPMPNADYAVASMTGGSDVTIENAYGVSYMSSGKTANGFSLGIRAVNGAFVDNGFDIHVASTNALPPRGTTGADGWGQFDGTDITTVDGEDRCNITASYNIEKVVRTGTGVYVVHFTTDMPTGSYAVVGNTNLTPNNNNTTVMVTDTSTDTCTLNVKAFGNNFVNSDLVTFTVHATNANLPATITQEQIDALVDGSTYKGIAAWALTDSAASADAGTVIPILGHNNIRSIEIAGGSPTRVQVLFKTPMPNANYSVVGTASSPNAAYNFSMNPDDRDVDGFTYYVNQVNTGALQPNVAVSFAVIALNAAPPRGTTGSDAWGHFTLNGSMLGSYNATVSRISTGKYQVTFNTAMPSTDYGVTVSCWNDSTTSGINAPFVSTYDIETTGFKIQSMNNAFALNDRNCSFTVNATNAQLPATITQEQIDALLDGNTYNGVSAWGNIAADNTINGGLNIASVTSAGAASALIYTVTFETPMPNADYSVVGSMTSSGTLDREFRVVTQTATEFTVGLFSPGGFSGAVPFNFIVTATNAAPPRGGTGADAWGNVNSDGTVNGSFNSTATRTAAGKYTVTFTNPMPNANYSVVASVATLSNGSVATVDNFTVNGFDVATGDGSSAADRPFSFVVHATNANLPATITTDQIAALIQNPTVSSWGYFEPADLTTQNTFNATVTSISTGQFQVTFNTPMPNADYAVATSSDVTSNNANACYIRIDDKTVNGFQFSQIASAGFNNPTSASFIVTSTARNGTLGGGADAWATAASTGVATGGFNLSVAPGGANTYAYTFTDPMPNANYAVLATPQDAVFATSRVYSKTTTGFSVLFQDVTGNTGNVLPCNHSVAVFATDGNAGGFWQSTGTQGTNTQVISPLNNQATLTIDSGSINFNNLPTADPAVAGQLWNDNGTLKISAG